MLSSRFLIFSFVIFILALLGAWVQFKLSRFYEKVPVEVYASSVIVPVIIGESSYNFQIDTGAPTGISHELFEILGTNVIDSTKGKDFYGNTAWVKRTVVPEIQIGNTKFKQVDASIVDPIQSFKRCDVEVDGYVGSDFFSDKILRIDLKHHEVIITNYRDKLALDKTKALSINFNQRQKTPLLPISINGNSSYDDVVFDTGAANDLFVLQQSDFYKMYSDSVLTKRNIIDTLHNASSGLGLFGRQKDTINYIIKFDSLKIGQFTVFGLVATTIAYEYKSILGAHALAFGMITIDYLHGDFYFDQYSELPGTLTNEHYGFSLRYKNGKFIVNSVEKGSIADLKTIKNGYFLKKINTRVLDSISICDILTLDLIFEECRQTGEYLFENNEKEIYLL